MRLIDVKILGIPRRGKFYQDPGLKHTSDIFHVLTTKTFIIRSSPRTGVRLTLTKKNQTNERSHVHSFPPPPKSVSRSSALLSRACTLTGLQRLKWLGVNTGSSRWSAPSYVNGLEFINASTSLIAVCSSSSVSPAFPTTTFRVFFATLTSDSNTPPKCDPSRGFQFHLSPLSATLPAICSWSIV